MTKNVFEAGNLIFVKNSMGVRVYTEMKGLSGGKTKWYFDATHTHTSLAAIQLCFLIKSKIVLVATFSKSLDQTAFVMSGRKLSFDRDRV